MFTALHSLLPPPSPASRLSPCLNRSLHSLLPLHPRPASPPSLLPLHLPPSHTLPLPASLFPFFFRLPLIIIIIIIVIMVIVMIMIRIMIIIMIALMIVIMIAMV